MKKYKILKWFLIALVSLFILVISFGYWFKSLIPAKDVEIEKAMFSDLPYLNENEASGRGKILAVVTSTDVMGAGGEKTGYELSELARAYCVFKAHGFEVDIASPEGGRAPVVIDDEDMGAYDYAFLNDPVAQLKVENTIPLEDVIKEDYQAVFFAGGKGAMYDFPDNRHIQSIVLDYLQEEKVVGAVCHGPAALVHVRDAHNRHIINGRRVSGFTNEEELFLIPDAETVFPFMLQDELKRGGGVFQEGTMYLNMISQDGNLITGQNPWSTWAVAEAMIEKMGHSLKARKITDEELAVEVLMTYKKHGKAEAKQLIHKITRVENQSLQRMLIAKHSIVAAMKGEIGSFVELVGLVSYAKKCEKL